MNEDRKLDELLGLLVPGEEEFYKTDYRQNGKDKIEEPDVQIDSETENNFTEIVGDENLSERAKKNLKEIEKFCNKTTKKFQSEFRLLVEVYREQGGRITNGLFERIIELGIDKPIFTIYAGDSREPLLSKFGYANHPLSEESFIMVFELPKLLSQYWNKGGENEWGLGSNDLSGMVIEWGYFYRRLLPIIWEEIDQFQSRSDCSIVRINPANKHLPLNYYYIFEVIDPLV